MLRFAIQIHETILCEFIGIWMYHQNKNTCGEYANVLFSITTGVSQLYSICIELCKNDVKITM